ncbi:MAG: hypothetical protein DAHOPDDO_02201 [Ignavibacteriaceae bacterium]|nr:hypothetical protein [Ignavibacteriaceae bacterium]
MISNKKAEAIGRILILAKELDSVKGENLKLQKILGSRIYFQKAGKWYYDVQKLSNKTISELNKISAHIKRTIK